MGKATPENKKRNDDLVARFLELTSKGGRGGWVSKLKDEFNLASSTIYDILKRRGITPPRTQKRNNAK